MNLHTITPVKSLKETKRRLAPILSEEQRRRLTFHMLADLAQTLTKAKTVKQRLLISSDREILSRAGGLGFKPLAEDADRGVNAAVALGIRHSLDSGAEAVLVLPADIPLVTVEDLEVMVRLGSRKPSLVLTPSQRFNGTNALLLHPPNLIETCYDADSFRGHLTAAEALGLKAKVYLSARVMLDLDLPEDVYQFLRLKTGFHTETYRFLSKLRLG